MIAKQHPNIFCFEVLDMTHVKCQNQTNQIFKNMNTLLPLLILPPLIMLSFILPLIICLQYSLITFILLLKSIRLDITNKNCQLVCLFGNINPFSRVNNRAVT